MRTALLILVSVVAVGACAAFLYTNYPGMFPLAHLIGGGGKPATVSIERPEAAQPSGHQGNPVEPVEVPRGGEPLLAQPQERANPPRPTAPATAAAAPAEPDDVAAAALLAYRIADIDMEIMEAERRAGPVDTRPLHVERERLFGQLTDYLKADLTVGAPK